MAFFMHYWARLRQRFEARRAIRALLLSLLVWAPWVAWAGAELEQLRAERTDEAWLLHAQVKLELTPAMEDALMRGLPVYFVAEAELVRERWYWTDRRVAQASRHYRLAYQPLTRQWRLNIGADPQAASANLSLAQSFDTLASALEVISRQSAWRLAGVNQVEADAKHTLHYSFRLDVAQLPRLFQITVGQQAEWQLGVNRSMRLVHEGAPK